MKYGLLQKVMWTGYRGTFRKYLTETLREEDPKGVMKAAYHKYHELRHVVIRFAFGEKQVYGGRGTFVLSQSHV